MIADLQRRVSPPPLSRKEVGNIYRDIRNWCRKEKAKRKGAKRCN